MRSDIRKLLKSVVSASGLDIEKVFFEKARLDRSRRRFDKQGYRRIEGYKVEDHYGDQDSDPSFQYVQEGFIWGRIRFIQQLLGSDEIRSSTFADIGDSNGIFLKKFGKDGTSVNVSQKVIENISGLRTLCAGLPCIPLPDKVFDYLLCFETIEHLHDPIAGLKELGRLARKGIFVSIPFVTRTNIHPFWPDRSRPAYEQHVLECSDEDFRKLLTYADLSVASMEVYRVFDYPQTVREVLVDIACKAVDRDLMSAVFRKFSIYFLVFSKRS